MDFRNREYLPHKRPGWVSDDYPLFITICLKNRGLSHFNSPHGWQALESTAEHLRSHGKWEPLLLLAMPDHIHGLVRIPKNHDISHVLGSFKRSVSYRIPTPWQKGAFEHRTRSYYDYLDKWDYILMNPVKNDLAKSVGEWPYAKAWVEAADGYVSTQC